jgi:hypothetical protein
VRRYTGGSNDTNTYAILGQLMQAGDFRRSFTQGPHVPSRNGPVLEAASYPEVLVAQAISDGDNLRLVLYPGVTDGVQTLGLERLAPGRTYTLTGATTPTLTASADGKASLNVMLSGRTAVTVTPA